MSDKTERIGNSWIQHGKHSDRVYLMKLDPVDLPEVLTEIEKLAEIGDYGKIFLKIPGVALPDCLAHGYQTEAFAPNFYAGAESVYFMAKYRHPTRSEIQNLTEIVNVLTTAKSRESRLREFEIEAGHELREMRKENAEEIAAIYRQVFKTYPFPIEDPDYILQTMAKHVVYFGVFVEGKLTAVASSEMDPEGLNVEMTDFATLPESRGKGLARRLLYEMEAAMRARGMLTAYTIARACSYGMNITFADLGYIFAGTLPNNTNISGGLESMNVWYKSLASVGETNQILRTSASAISGS